MPSASATVSLRMPAKTKARIDKAAKARNTSRTEYMMEAVAARLDAPDPAAGQARRVKEMQDFLAKIRELRANVPVRSAEDIDAGIREFRGEE